MEPFPCCKREICRILDEKPAGSFDFSPVFMPYGNTVFRFWDGSIFHDALIDKVRVSVERDAIVRATHDKVPAAQLDDNVGVFFA